MGFERSVMVGTLPEEYVPTLVFAETHFVPVNQSTGLPVPYKYRYKSASPTKVFEERFIFTVPPLWMDDGETVICAWGRVPDNDRTAALSLAVPAVVVELSVTLATVPSVALAGTKTRTVTG